GRMLSALHGAAVDEVVMVGPVRRPSLAELRPDARALRELARIGGARGDDHLLSAITTLLEREGFRVIGVDQVVHGLTVKPGLLGQRRPDRTARQDISRGIMAARSLGVADIGQAVVVQDGIVLAAEAAEGTTAMVRRAGDLARAGRGGVLVKTVKPGQNRRVDLPTIGPETLEAAATAGLRGIMIEANGVLVLERARCIAMADDAGLFLLSEAVGPA
ncbi:MAG: UDP-2,3-diacylglucosamine diphosphatase LpxI, partial [Alphaproteobacteria bacterium]